MDPLARSPLGSIWTNVSREEFENKVDALQRNKKIVLEPEDYTGADPAHDENTHGGLPLHVERKLADDFACISAYDVGVETVTAAAIESSVDPPGITVRLAANAGIQDCVQNAIKDILRTLTGCSKKSSHRARCKDDILSIVVRLNKNKIYSRLGTELYERPAHEFYRKLSSLGSGLRAFVEKRRTCVKQQEWMLLLREIEEFQVLVDALEGSSDPKPVEELKEIVKKAWLVAGKEISVKKRLRRLGIPNEELDNKAIRAMDKIANYWRICQDLVNIRLTRGYSGFFNNVQLKTIEHYAPAPPAAPLIKKPRPPERFVHAEIQLITYYEVTGVRANPRIIGASKEACFLCDAFIKSHGRFSVSKAHKRVMNQWTVPERQEYSADSLKSIRGSMVAVYLEICRELTRTQRQKRSYPPQSSINENSAMIVSVASSSVGRMSSSGSIRELAKRSSTSTVKASSRGSKWEEVGSMRREGSSSSRSASASTIRPAGSRLSSIAELPVTLQAGLSTDKLSISSSRQTSANASPIAQADGDYAEMASEQTQETRRNSPKRVVRSDTAGPDSAVQLLAAPAEYGEVYMESDRTVLSPLSTRQSCRHEEWTVSSGCPAHARLRKLNLHVYFEEGLTTEGGCTSANVRVRTPDEYGVEADETVDIGAMAGGDEVVLARPEKANDRKLSVRLQVGNGEDTVLLCSWQASELEGLASHGVGEPMKTPSG